MEIHKNKMQALEQELVRLKAELKKLLKDVPARAPEAKQESSDPNSAQQLRHDGAAAAPAEVAASSPSLPSPQESSQAPSQGEQERKAALNTSIHKTEQALEDLRKQKTEDVVGSLYRYMGMYDQSVSATTPSTHV